MLMTREMFISIFLSCSFISVPHRLLAYVMKFAPPENPIVIGSCKSIAKYLGCSTSSVEKAFRSFEEKGIVKKLQNGVWEVNYEVIELLADVTQEKTGRLVK